MKLFRGSALLLLFPAYASAQTLTPTEQKMREWIQQRIERAAGEEELRELLERDQHHHDRAPAGSPAA